MRVVGAAPDLPDTVCWFCWSQQFTGREPSRLWLFPIWHGHRLKFAALVSTDNERKVLYQSADGSRGAMDLGPYLDGLE